ncbi:YqeG family HAD IIIA-type phosphatase [Myxosarcina sp. GI1]|uniref:YqeG family HAD IIIA-type phosphatase n=1 Tax=Myxosarcina sp. GI1 TaxID=1541065 RepID=UPI0009077CE7
MYSIVFKTNLLQPDLILSGTIVELNPQVFQDNQIKGLILDVDETLVSYQNHTVSADLQQWIAEVRQMVPIWLVSNNISEGRIGNIARSLELPYISGARKPSRRKLRQAAREMDLPVERVAMIGDRLFTDVLAGNRLGMFTILVSPMSSLTSLSHNFSIHNLEAWLSQLLGVSLAATQHNSNKINP